MIDIKDKQALFGNRKVDHIIVHCSATPTRHRWTSVNIDRDHRAKGYLGNGYHVVIPRDGSIEMARCGHKCRPLSKAGAHVGDCGPGWNARTVGICLVGGVDNHMEPENNFTDAQMEALRFVLAAFKRILPEAEIMGHRDLIKKTGAQNKKACPSFDVKGFISGL